MGALVGDAIDYLVTHYDVPINSSDEAQRAFRNVTGYRIKRFRGVWVPRTRSGCDLVFVDETAEQVAALN